MKRGLNSRQIKRQHGVDVKEVFSLYDAFKQEVSTIEGNVAKDARVRNRQINVQEVMKEMNLPKGTLSVKDILGMLNGKMTTLDEKIFELKQENDLVTFPKKPNIKIRTYSEKAHD